MCCVRFTGPGCFSFLACSFAILSAHAVYLGCRMGHCQRLCFSDAAIFFMQGGFYLATAGLPSLASSPTNEKKARAACIGLGAVLMFVIRHARDICFLRPPERNKKGHITKRGTLQLLRLVPHILYFDLLALFLARNLA